MTERKRVWKSAKRSGKLLNGFDDDDNTTLNKYCGTHGVVGIAIM